MTQTLTPVYDCLICDPAGLAQIRAAHQQGLYAAATLAVEVTLHESPSVAAALALCGELQAAGKRPCLFLRGDV